MRLAVLSLFILLQSVNPLGSRRSLFKYQKFYQVDMSKYAVLPEDEEAINILFGKGYRFKKLRNADLVEIDSILTKAVENHKKEGRYVLVNNSGKYYKQVLAATNEKGEQEVYLNCLCSLENKEDWKQRFILIMDGGSCYFQVKMNLKIKKVISFSVNGLG